MIVPAEAPARTLTLVTGATGFTGSHLVRSLVADGVPVRVIARSAERARQLLPDGVEIIEGDIADPEVIERAMRGVGTVYHLAAVYREAKHPDLRYREVNVEASRLLLEAAVRASVRRYVHCSTVGVHGHIAAPPADESAAYAPGDVYQATKCEAEQLALTYRDRIPLAVARPTAIYGPGDTRLLKMFRLIAQQRFPLLGGGENYYHTVHVKDLVRGLRLLGTHSRAVGESLHSWRRILPEALRARGHDRERGRRAGSLAPPAGPALPAGRLPGGEALRALRHRAADLSPPGGLLHQEPGLQHREGAVVSWGIGPKCGSWTASARRWTGTWPTGICSPGHSSRPSTSNDAGRHAGPRGRRHRVVLGAVCQAVCRSRWTVVPRASGPPHARVPPRPPSECHGAGRGGRPRAACRSPGRCRLSGDGGGE